MPLITSPLHELVLILVFRDSQADVGGDFYAAHWLATRALRRICARVGDARGHTFVICVSACL